MILLISFFSTAMIDPQTTPEEGILFRCDTVMMVHAPDGSLHFNDDGGSANLSLLRLPRMAGLYKVWVGPLVMGLRARASCVCAGLICPALALACPPQLTAAQLGESWTVDAGGPRDVRGCRELAGLVDDQEALGFITAAPTLSIPADLSIEQDTLIIDGVAVCDTVLVAQDGAGNWHFSDDTGDNLNPQLTFETANFAGARVWFGSYDIGACEGSLRLTQQSSTLCPDPDLPPSAAARLGEQMQISIDAVADLATCGDHLSGLAALDLDGFTSLNPDLGFTVTSLTETPSLTVNLDSSCQGQILVHHRGDDGMANWQILTELPFDIETVNVSTLGAYAFWLVINDEQEGCAGTLTLDSERLSCPSLDMAGRETHTLSSNDLIAGRQVAQPIWMIALLFRV